MKRLDTYLLTLALAAALGCGRQADPGSPPVPPTAADSEGTKEPSPHQVEGSAAATTESAAENQAPETAVPEPESPVPSAKEAGTEKGEEKPTEKDTSPAQVPPEEEPSSPGKKKFPNVNHPVVAIEGEKGVLYIELRPDQSPQHTANFLKLVKEGFYQGIRWHRREEGFLIQGGDPLSKRPDWRSQPLGTGDVGYSVAGEFGLKHGRGAVAMARQRDENNPERRSSGSQFYICLSPVPILDGQYSVFGQVIEGLEVADKTQIGDAMQKVYVVQE